MQKYRDHADTAMVDVIEIGQKGGGNFCGVFDAATKVNDLTNGIE